MKPPPDRLLDLRGTGTDLPARTRPRYGVQWTFVLLTATLLGLFSSGLAWQLTRSMGKPLVYGQSITDACIDWPTSVRVLERLATAVRARRLRAAAA